MFQLLQQNLQQMLDCGVIRSSHSPWASNIVLVKKKDGKLQFCIDYNKPNQGTVKDANTIPRMKDTFDLHHGKSWFTMYDLKVGSWQVELGEEAKT